MKSQKSARVCPLFWPFFLSLRFDTTLVDTVVIEISLAKALRLRSNLRRLYWAKHLIMTYSGIYMQ